MSCFSVQRSLWTPWYIPRRRQTLPLVSPWEYSCRFCWSLSPCMSWSKPSTFQPLTSWPAMVFRLRRCWWGTGWIIALSGLWNLYVPSLHLCAYDQKAPILCHGWTVRKEKAEDHQTHYLCPGRTGSASLLITFCSWCINSQLKTRPETCICPIPCSFLSTHPLKLHWPFSLLLCFLYYFSLLQDFRDHGKNAIFCGRICM